MSKPNKNETNKMFGIFSWDFFINYQPEQSILSVLFSGMQSVKQWVDENKKETVKIDVKPVAVGKNKNLVNPENVLKKAQDIANAAALSISEEKGDDSSRADKVKGSQQVGGSNSIKY